MLGFVNIQPHVSVADPGFPVGGMYPLGCGPPMRAFFGQNVCENARIGFHRGRHAPDMSPLDLLMCISSLLSKRQGSTRKTIT